MARFAFSATLLSVAIWATAASAVTVDCDAGQSLSKSLATLNKLTPATVTVKGTCTEYVLIDGFNNLTLNAVQGATLQHPSTNPQGNQYVLSIRASRSLTVSGLAVHSLPSIFSAIGVGGGSNDILLQSVSTDGSWGVVVYEGSQVWLKKVTVNITSGYGAVSAFDNSDVHIVDSLLERPTDSNFYAGLFVGSGNVNMQGTTIRDMQQSINISGSGSVGVGNFDPTAAGIDVFIENPSGTNYNGAIVTDSSSLNISSAKLHISNAGQSYGYDTGAVLVTNGSTLNAGASLIVTSSQGQGVIVSNGSHAELAGSSITGGVHGGLVVVNLSTAGVDSSTPLTVIGANGTDLFCDSKSQIAGVINISNAKVVQCNNLLTGNYVSLP
jgi:hypothetical protein